MLQWNTRLLVVLALVVMVAAMVGGFGWEALQFGW
jgi:hypothetical protein